MSLLEVENLWVRFPTRQGIFDAVRGVSFALERERLGIVGESGSGKSMTGRAILRLIRKPGIVESDAIRLEGLVVLLGCGQSCLHQAVTHVCPCQAKHNRGPFFLRVKSPHLDRLPAMT